MGRYLGVSHELAETATGEGKDAMSSRSTLLALLAALLSAVAALPSVASATVVTLHLNAVVFGVHEGKGVFLSRERVSDGKGLVGEDSTRCVSISRSKIRCHGIYTLPQGTIRFSGTQPRFTDSNLLAITGGTGAYAGAHGIVLTQFNRSGSRAKELLKID